MVLDVHSSEFRGAWDDVLGRWVIGTDPVRVIDGTLTILEVEAWNKSEGAYTGRSITWDVVASEPYIHGGILLKLKNQRWDDALAAEVA